MVDLERSDIQGNILRGYRFPFATHLFFGMRSPEQARAFLRGISVTSDAAWQQKEAVQSALNVALSFSGLARLRQCDDVRERFPAFYQGMPERAAVLGDSPDVYERHWRSTDVLLSIYGRTAQVVEDERRRLLAEASAHLELLNVEHGEALQREDGWYEHFGFRDDISNPQIDGAHEDDRLGPGTGRVGPDGSWLPIRTGEFLLGYENESGDSIPEGELSALLKNGTFMVFRKLEQRVREFRAYLKEVSDRYGVDPQATAESIVGRRLDGTPLVEPRRPDVILNDFDYSDDKRGLRCPIGAHVRRVQPRAVTDAGGTSGRHRLLRRGMPYGPTPREESNAGNQGGESEPKECGLLFIALNANIEEQFEFLQRFWVNSSSRSGVSNDRDPLVGAHQTAGKMIIPGMANASGLPLMLPDLPRFVWPKGGQYFFVPGLAALRALCVESAEQNRVVD